MKKNRKGFTLAELLIVVAIIAVLVAIAIPVFTNQLENSRESTDAANIRSAYAEVVAAALENPTTAVTATIEKKQKVADWQNKGIEDIAGVKISEINSTTATTVSYDGSSKVLIDGKEAKTSFLNNSTTP
ncbi:MAG: prepilin-type N-terminal cleavage/methylation domain-containing protein [Lachnospiraceae bacterium]|nr:prepilin-type N-terminal cleavage/methylation domain-containing protein [Lachnospiraceae bacterium]